MWDLEWLPDDVGFISNLSHYCKKLSFSMLLKQQLHYFLVRFLCVLKIYHVRFGMAPRRYGIHFKPQPLLQKTFIFHASETVAALFSSESQVFLVRFLCFKNIPCKAFYSGKNGVWNGSQTMWDSFQTSTIIAKNFHFPCF